MNGFVRGLNKIMDVLGFYGLAMRSRPHDEAKELEGRQWGPTVAGFGLSIAPRPPVIRAREPVQLAVALRNETGADVRQTIPDWIGFLVLDVRRDDASPVNPTAYGRLLAARREVGLSALFPAGAAVQIDLPLSELYGLAAAGVYRIVASCGAPGTQPIVQLESNAVELRVTARSE